jgi:hypothetical protein
VSDSLFRKLGQEGAQYKEKVDRNLRIAQVLYRSLFRQQQQLLDDPNPYKCLRTPRRSGKSYACAVAAVCKCLRKAKARVVLIGLTLKSTRGSFWRILDDIMGANGIEAESNKTELSYTFSNGSYLYIFGAETMDRIERLRGDEYDLVIVDEAKSFSPETLRYLIQDVLMAAVATRIGEIWLTGTPGHIFEGPFYYASNPGKADKEKRVHSIQFRPEVGLQKESFWSFHTWTMEDNTKVPGQWQRAVDDKERLEWTDEHPTWRREFLGEWVVDESGLVFSFAALCMEREDLVTWVPDLNHPGNYGLPEGAWSFLCGIDFGWENPTAFVVAAYSRSLQEIRELHSEKHSYLTLAGVAEIYRNLERRFGGFEATIVDAGAQGEQIQRTLATDHNIPAIPAQKRDKPAYIQIVNSDMHSGRIKLLKKSQLAEEMTRHCWDLSEGSREELARKGRLKEHPSSPNDLCDSFLYIWRFSSHRWYEAEQSKPPSPDEPSYFDRLEAEAKERFSETRRLARLEADLVEGEFELTEESAYRIFRDG